MYPSIYIQPHITLYKNDIKILSTYVHDMTNKEIEDYALDHDCTDVVYVSILKDVSFHLCGNGEWFEESYY